MILGIVYNEKKKIINHRSLLKVILNPFLRLIGFEIRTMYENNKLYGVKIFKCKIRWTFEKYKLGKNYIVKKERIFI